jgi:hypothetical protein
MAITGGRFQAGDSYRAAVSRAPGGGLTAINGAEKRNSSLDLTYAASGAAGTFNAVLIGVRTLAASTSETLDLAAGTFGSGTEPKDPFGGTYTLTKIAYIEVAMVSTTGAGVRVGGAASNAHKLWFADASDKADVLPGGVPFKQGHTTGLTVDSSNRNILIENLSSVASQTYRITVVGVD